MEAPCPEIEVFDDLTQDRSTSMTDQAISPLRRRMIEDMTIRKFVAKTQHDYVQRVKDFAVFLGRSPSTASKEDVRRFQLMTLAPHEFIRRFLMHVLPAGFHRIRYYG